MQLECLIGLRTDWGRSTVVVPAVYKEWGLKLPLRAPGWLIEQAPVFLYQRLDPNHSCYAANSGYESGVYLRFIVDHYNRLPAHTVFAQADWFSSHKGLPPHAFDFWQLRCLRGNNATHSNQPELQAEALASGTHHEQGWRHWMPLGLRHTIYPPYQVPKKTDCQNDPQESVW